MAFCHNSDVSSPARMGPCLAVTGTKRNKVPFDCQTGTAGKKRRTKYFNWNEHAAAVLQVHVDARKNKQSVQPSNDVLIPSYTTTVRVSD